MENKSATAVFFGKGSTTAKAIKTLLHSIEKTLSDTLFEFALIESAGKIKLTWDKPPAVDAAQSKPTSNP